MTKCTLAYHTVVIPDVNGLQITLADEGYKLLTAMSKGFIRPLTVLFQFQVQSLAVPAMYGHIGAGVILSAEPDYKAVLIAYLAVLPEVDMMAF